jgi:hypothetical protein
VGSGTNQEEILRPAAPQRIRDSSPSSSSVRFCSSASANVYAGDARVAEIGALLRADAPEHGPLWDCRGVGAFGTHDVVTAGLPARAHLMRPGEHPCAAVLVLVPA